MRKKKFRKDCCRGSFSPNYAELDFGISHWFFTEHVHVHNHCFRCRCYCGSLNNLINNIGPPQTRFSDVSELTWVYCKSVWMDHSSYQNSTKVTSGSVGLGRFLTWRKFFLPAFHYRSHYIWSNFPTIPRNLIYWLSKCFQPILLSVF